jgi:hypothetical protein
MLYPLSYGGSSAGGARPGCGQRLTGRARRPTGRTSSCQAVGRALRPDSRTVTGALVALLDR